MISSAFARVAPPPSPSQASAKPSSWKQPVSSRPKAVASSTASTGGKIAAAASQARATSPPISAPTAGSQRGVAAKRAGV